MTITLKDGPTPRIVISDADNNVIIGNDISSITTAFSNVVVGIDAGSSLTTAGECIAIGNLSQNANAIQSNNISIGYRALSFLSSGTSSSNVVIGNNTAPTATNNVNQCIALGDLALFSASSAGLSNLVAIGVNAGFDVTNASSSSILIGHATATGMFDFTNCIFIGESATSTTTTGLTNSIALGTSTSINVSNGVNIGNGCKVGLNNPSPLYNLDIATISNVAAIRVADSSSTPSTPSGAALYYSVAGIPTYMNSNAVARSIPHRTSVTVSGTSKTFALTDTDTLQVCTNGSTVTLTVDTNANVAFPIDTEIDLFQQGAGQIVVAAAGGVTIQSVNSNLKIAAQYTGATLKKLATNTWLLTGNLTA